MLSIYIALAVLASLTSASVPKCDSKVIATLGTPIKNITAQLFAYGQSSYSWVSTSEQTLFGLKVKCMRIKVVDVNTAKVTYTFSLFPSISLTFPISEGDGFIEQNDSMVNYKLYLTYMKNGAFCAYRCCDTCTGSAANVGCGTADALKGTSDTRAALAEGVARMTSLGVWSDVAQLDC